MNVRRDGSRFPVLLWSDLLTDVDGERIGIVTCSEDVTERKRAEEALRDIALRDPLTALPNRVFFVERPTQAIHSSLRHDEGRFAVLFLDLDRFKVVNDSLGHQAGDELLVRISERLVLFLRPGDVVARFGGDEFAVLLEGTAREVAERIHLALAKPIRLGGYEPFMDDFGTGYSSLTYLHRLPLDSQRIDRSFVSRIERSNRHAQPVEIIVNLARNVRLGLVAEGHKQPGAARTPAGDGLRAGQGFLFSRRLIQGDAEELLRRRRHHRQQAKVGSRDPRLAHPPRVQLKSRAIPPWP